MNNGLEQMGIDLSEAFSQLKPNKKKLIVLCR